MVMINQTRTINDSIPNKLLTFIQPLLNHQKEPKITIFGVAYKGNIEDTRESPVLSFIKNAQNKTINLSIYDLHLEHFTYPFQSIKEATKDSDCIILLTDHDSFKDIDPKKVKENMRTPQIVDTRNILNKSRWENAGFNYYLLFNSS